MPDEEWRLVEFVPRRTSAPKKMTDKMAVDGRISIHPDRPTGGSFQVNSRTCPALRRSRRREKGTLLTVLIVLNVFLNAVGATWYAPLFPADMEAYRPLREHESKCVDVIHYIVAAGGKVNSSQNVTSGLIIWAFGFFFFLTTTNTLHPICLTSQSGVPQ